MSFRWYYVDDSGSPQSGWIVYGFVQVAAEDWSAAPDHWLRVRNYLLSAYGIDAYTELHAYRFINGRGNPSKDPEWNRCKALRHQVAVEVLQAVARMPGVRVGAVARHTDARRDAYAREQLDVYRCFLDSVTDWLRATGEYGTVVVERATVPARATEGAPATETSAPDRRRPGTSASSSELPRTLLALCP
ncbi:hypothetical protein ABH935_002464 [Catenulispora sp. GAS73]|uniref:hypothetical protein n=1 Tax=Catenulispora sp. GAS73 TaxID=3156269 RepID=UPI0035127191